jgi:hypothetical protein
VNLVGRNQILKQLQVKPNNTISLSSAVGSDTQQVCINSTIANITYTAIGATGAVFSGLPAGIISNFNNGNIFIIGTPTISGNYPYSILLTGGCDSVSASGLIQVNPINTISLSSAVGSDTQQVCVNNPITNITYTSTGATSAMFNGLPPGVVGSFNNGNIDISGTTNTVGYFNYSVDEFYLNDEMTIQAQGAMGTTSQVVFRIEEEGMMGDVE